MRPDYVLRLDKQMYRFEQQEDTLDLAKRGSTVRGGAIKPPKKKKVSCGRGKWKQSGRMTNCQAGIRRSSAHEGFRTCQKMSVSGRRKTMTGRSTCNEIFDIPQK